MEYVMKYDFDEVVERRGTGCLKYDFAKERGKKEDVLPLWVADMDFKTVPAVTKDCRKQWNMGFMGTVTVRKIILQQCQDGTVIILTGTQSRNG